MDKGICMRCGKEMERAGRLWLFCGHCGSGQIWPGRPGRTGGDNG